MRNQTRTPRAIAISIETTAIAAMTPGFTFCDLEDATELDDDVLVEDDPALVVTEEEIVASGVV
jgi:Fe-S cluster assembly iron-binding protein IscA